MTKLSIKNVKIKRISIFSKIFLRSCLITVFVILLSLFGIMAFCFGDYLYNNSRGLNKNPLLNVFVIVSESMVPTIKVNDAIVIKRVKDNTLDIGDIITFSSSDNKYYGLTITHRVVDKKLSDSGNYIYKTKGDNNIVADTAYVEGDKVYGKVLFKIAKIGYIYNFITTPFGFILSIIIPVLLVIMYELWRIIKVMKRRYHEVQIL